MSVVAILGYGRFGAALAGLAEEAGHAVRALDPHANVPAARRAASLEALVVGSDVVVVAVPVPAMEAALRGIRPFLVPAQLVLDVGSVKVKPTTALERVLGAAIPWLGTHPLFGPTSLALAERPLRVILCPNAIHPGAAPRARAFFETMGCQLLEQDPHDHDRAMAETHALAFFVAKGIVDAGVATNVPYAPPSFQAIARTVDTVRADAGHLFTAIQRDNPYAAEARARFLDALRAVDGTVASLEASAASGLPPAPGSAADVAETARAESLAIPDLGARSPDLQEARQFIDELDRELLVLLARRGELARRAGQAKAEMGKGVYDPGREARVLEARREWAAEVGMDAESVDDVFRAIFRFSRRLQNS